MVHGQGAAGGLRIGGFELQDLQEPALTAACDPPLRTSGLENVWKRDVESEAYQTPSEHVKISEASI